MVGGIIQGSGINITSEITQIKNVCGFFCFFRFLWVFCVFLYTVCRVQVLLVVCGFRCFLWSSRLAESHNVGIPAPPVDYAIGC